MFASQSRSRCRSVRIRVRIRSPIWPPALGTRTDKVWTTRAPDNKGLLGFTGNES